MEQAGQYLNHPTNLSAEVEPFIPRSDAGIPNLMAEHMIPHSTQGPLPHYLTSCYPFVQDANGANVQADPFGYHNFYKDPRGFSAAHMGPTPNFQHPGQHGRYPDGGMQPSAANIPHPHSSPYYAYHPDSAQLQYANFAQVQYTAQYGAAIPRNQYTRKSSQGKKEHSNRPSSERKQYGNKKNQRSVGIQMERQGPEKNKEDMPQHEMIDCALQTDFPSDIASKTLVERPSPLKKMTRTSRRRRAHVAADRNASCESSDNNGDEADVDSDSGYYSPKHQLSKRKNALLRSAGNSMHDDAAAGYPLTDAAHQRLMYVPGPPSGHPSALYHIHPNSFMGRAHRPGQVIRLPTPATPPMIMTPPPGMNPSTIGHQVAVSNFKQRSPWEQEVLKAHNVAPISPPNFVARSQAPFPQNRMRGTSYQPKNWNYPRFQGARQPLQQQNNNSLNHRHHVPSPSQGAYGLLRVNPSTAPSNLVHQNPPILTDEDFPDLRPSSGMSGGGTNSHSTISYSAALQRTPKSASDDRGVSDDSPIKNVVDGDDSAASRGSRRRKKKTERAAKAAAEEYAEITEEQENIKKKLNSKKATAKPKSSQQLNLGEIVNKLEKSQNKSDSEESQLKRNNQGLLKGRAPAQRSQQYFVPYNPLDASAPMKKKGKEREIPKVKKPSALKKVILKEREEKKTARIATLTTEDAPEYDIPPVSTEFFKKEYMNIDDSLDKSASDGLSASENNNSGTASPITVSSQVAPGDLPKIHSRRYREYCSGQVLDKEIDEECINMLQKLVQFQERTYQRDPMNAKNKRRFVLGIREVTKHLKLRKLCCVLISPNLEKIQAKGGLDDALQQIMQLCKSQSVPYVFALGRRAMGRAVSKLVPVSIIGIFNYNGADESYKRMLSLVEDAQRKYDEMMVLYKQEITEAILTPPVAPPAPKRFPHMGHSRNASAASGISFCSMISEPISEMPLDGTNWRNMMDVTDEQNPAPTLSPPAETAQEEELQCDTEPQQEKPQTDNAVDPEVKDMLDSSFESASSEEQRDQNEIKLENSFSTVSTIVPQKDKTANEVIDSKAIDIVVESTLPVTDPESLIESWLATSVQTLEIDDSRAQDDKTDEACDDEQIIEEDEDDFLSTHEDEPGDE